MAKITPGELERLNLDVPLAKLAERAGVVLERSGQNELRGACPFHAGGEPSLAVTPHKNLWGCSTCGAEGNAVEWVMKREGVSLTHAVEILRRDFALLVNDTTASGKRYQQPPLAVEFARTADDQALLNQVMDYYHQTLKQSPEALGYLQKRGLTDPAVIDQFKLGFANRTLGYRLPHTKQKGGPGLRGQLQRLGVMRASGHEHFTGSLVIPILDAQGNLVQAYGRKITKNLRAGTPDHLYLPGPHRGVFNLPALAISPDVILCEALIDALTFWCAGFRNVTASYGPEGVHPGPPGRVQAPRHQAGADRLRPGRRRQRRRRERGRHPHRRRVRVLPRAVPQEHGCQQLRAQDPARRQGLRASHPQGGMDGQGRDGRAGRRACGNQHR